MPGSLLKRALRAPLVIYDVGADRLFGHRFLLLTHRGRRSGRRYRTMLEVVSWDRGLREAVVMSGFGRRAGWYLNVLAGGAEEIRIGGTAFRPQMRQLDTDEAVSVLAAYEHRNRFVAPLVRLVLSRLSGLRYDGSAAARRRLVERLPLVAFRDYARPRPGGA
jgi:deazaflavin-dependent oxidoreductase (nitroreductase family)